MNIQDEVLKKFKQPLRYDKEDQRVLDADNRLVVDVRAWGYLSSTIKNQQLAMQIQDELGEMVAKAFNHCYPEVNCNKHGVMQGLLSKCPHCQGTGIDPEIPNYDKPPNSSPTVADGAAGKTVSGGNALQNFLRQEKEIEKQDGKIFDE